MIRTLIVSLLLIAALVAGMAFVPLEAVLNAAGLRNQEIGWTSARGSVFSGRIEGLSVKGTEYGTADLRLVPAALTQRQMTYEVDWTGPKGIGSSRVTVRGADQIELTDYEIDLDLAAFARSARWVEKSGGRMKLQGTQLSFTNGRCAQATGRASSDVLERNRDALGAGWSPLEGELRCEDGALVVPLLSENTSGTRFGAVLKAAPGVRTRFEARISGKISRPMAFALPLAGFARDGEEFVYVPGTKKTVAAAP
ncbi:MAG: type II secretion system protein N [Hyphomonas sp.]